MNSTGIVLVDHGSRRDDANDMLLDMATLLQEQALSSFVAVEIAHMELAEPTLEQAFARCVEAGATTIVVSLFFLSPGRHSRSDLPAMVEQLQQAYPDVRCLVTGPLGADRRLAELLFVRIRETLKQEGTD